MSNHASEAWSLPILWHALRDALRVVRKQPRFSAAAIFTLALGIGATTAIYSVVHGVLLKPLPFPDPDRLVVLHHVTPASATDLQGAATYFTYRDHGQVFEDVGLWNTGTVAAIHGGAPEQVRVLVGQNLTLGTRSEGPLIPYSGGFDLVTLAVGCAPQAVALITSRQI